MAERRKFLASLKKAAEDAGHAQKTADATKKGQQLNCRKNASVWKGAVESRLERQELEQSNKGSESPCPAVNKSCDDIYEEFCNSLHQTSNGNSTVRSIKRNLFVNKNEAGSNLQQTAAAEHGDLVLGISPLPSPHLPANSAILVDPHGQLFDSLPVGVVFDIPVIDDSLHSGTDDPIVLNVENNDILPSENESTPAGPQSPMPKGNKRFTPPDKWTRKRQSKPGKWKRNISKDELSKGLEHKSEKGVLRRARQLQVGCGISCRNKCHLKITEAQRQEVFSTFWQIPTQVEKWGFIGRHLKLNSIKNSSLSTPKKKTSREYFFRVQGNPIKVCKTMFLDTLDVCDSWVETAVEKMEADGAISPDKRGKNSKRPMPSIERFKVSVRNHIGTLPRMPSHYTRENSNKEYLVEEFQSTADMHAAYIEWMSRVHPDEPVATVRQYRDVFNYEFHIDFFLPKKDLCDMCVTWDNTPVDQRGALEENYLKHTRNKELVIAMKDADTKVARLKTSKSLVVAHFDYEKALNCPKANSSVFYYKRKLCVSNFTIVDVGRHEDCCYVYDETVAKKGSKEVASFLHHFIKRKVETGVNEFRFYSDNCGGQNKNRNVVTSLVYAAAKYNVKIVHKFLEKGHTYNSADTVHSLIERKTRPFQLYAPVQWYEKMAEAKRSKQHPMIVIRVDQDIIYDWNDLTDMLNMDKDINGRTIQWTKIRQVSADGSNPHQFQFKVNFNDEASIVSTKTVGRPVNFSTYELKKAYQGPLPISKLKHKDLMFYCDNNLIPVMYHDFFRGLTASENLPDSDPEDAPVGRPRKRRAVKKTKLVSKESENSQQRCRKRRVASSEKSKKRRCNQISESNSDIDNPEFFLSD